MIAEFEQALAGTASALGTMARADFGERGLEAALAEQLEQLADESWAEVRRQVGVKQKPWPGLGPVDLALADATGDLVALAELKCDGAKLYECSWDMAKLALCCAAGLAPFAFLVAAAPVEDWETNPGRELFAARFWGADVLLERFGRDFAHWRGQVHSHPKQLPAVWRAVADMSAPFGVDGRKWELRAVAIEVELPTLVSLHYLPTAPGSPSETPLDAARPASVEPLGDSPERALEALGHEEGGTVLLAEGGSVSAVELTGLRTDETLILELAGDEDLPSTSTRWFVSPAHRRAYLEQRGWRRAGSPEPDVLELFAGSGLGSGFELSWTGSQLVLSRHRWDGEQLLDHLHPTDPDWVLFWRRLDRLDTWSWAHRYEPEYMATDGYGWEVNIAFIGRRCRSEGYMAYPGGGDGLGEAAWDAFLLAVQDLVGGRELH